MDKPKILVVEDRDDLKEMYLRQIKGPDWVVSSASNGEEALKLVAAEDFSVILTDINMPGSVDGVALVHRVKREKPAIDCIVMTAFPELDTAIQTLKDGAYDYLSKPFTREQLLLVINRCLDKRRIQDELGQEKTLRKELEAAYAEIKKADKLKDAFMARVSHELRTPLFAAQGPLEILESSLAPEQAALVGKSRKALARLGEVVGDLLNFSDLLKGEKPARREPVDLGLLIKEVFQSYKSVYEQKELKVQLELPDGLPKVPGDPELLRTAFKHMVVNAAQFNQLKGLVAVRAHAAADHLSLELENSGKVVPEDQAGKMFDSFFQLAEVMTREVGGLGLGLAIVRRIIEAHGGTIRVAPRQGGGAIFYVALPTA